MRGFAQYIIKNMFYSIIFYLNYSIIELLGIGILNLTINIKAFILFKLLKSHYSNKYIAITIEKEKIKKISIEK